MNVEIAYAAPMPATARRRPKHDPKVSEREILDAAELLLRERPFREITVEHVMSRTGLKRPAFYVHFRDRHELALRVVEKIGAELFEMTDRWLQGDDFRAALEGLASVYLRLGPVMRALADAAGADARVEAAYRELVEQFIEATAGHIRAEQARGRIRDLVDVDQTARALIWMNERYLLDSFGSSPQADPAVVVAVLQHIWVSALYSGAR